ncbi:hypothetical protein Tco_0094868, partial [Tanacetum coccineum]
HLFDDEDSGNDHLPKADSRKDWWKPLPKAERPVTPQPTWTIPSSNKIKAYSRYGYDYLSEIVLRRANHQEHTIAEKDFKNLYPNDFEDLNMLLLQGHLGHLSGSDKRILSIAVKLWT